MRLIIDVRGLNDSGIGVYIVNIINHLIKYKDITLTCLVKRGQTLPFECNVKEVDFGHLSYKNLSIGRFIGDYDVYFLPCLSLPPLLCKPKVISTIHDMCPVALTKYFGFFKGALYWIIALFQLLLSNHVFTISRFSLSEIEKYYTKVFSSKISVIHNGLTDRSKTTASTHQTPFLDNLPNKYFLCVGNVKPHKNVVHLVQSFSERERFLDYKLILVGKKEGFLTGTKLNFGSFGDDIIFTDVVSDSQLDTLYRNASAYIFPSIYEGFGLPLLEAMSYNLPIYCSDIPVFKEIALNTVVYYNPNDFCSFFNSGVIYEVEEGRYSEILSRHTWDSVAKKIKLVLNKITTED